MCTWERHCCQRWGARESNTKQNNSSSWTVSCLCEVGCLTQSWFSLEKTRIEFSRCSVTAPPSMLPLNASSPLDVRHRMGIKRTKKCPITRYLAFFLWHQIDVELKRTTFLQTVTIDGLWIPLHAEGPHWLLQTQLLLPSSHLDIVGGQWSPPHPTPPPPAPQLFSSTCASQSKKRKHLQLSYSNTSMRFTNTAQTRSR